MVERKKPGQKKARKKFTWSDEWLALFERYFQFHIFSLQGEALRCNQLFTPPVFVYCTTSIIIIVYVKYCT